MSFIRVSALFLFFFVAANGQTMPSIRGEVQSAPGSTTDGLMAQLWDPASHRVVARVVIISGTFEFHNIAVGRYDVQIATQNGDPLVSAPVDSSSMFGPVQLRLPHEKRNLPGAGTGTVSIASLRNPPPKKAFNEFAAGVKASEAKDTARAIEHLQKAIALHPDFAEAHNNLAVQFMRTNRWNEAKDEIDAALRAGPGTPQIYGNLAAILFCLRRVEEAEAAARQAIKLDSRNLQAHYLLGRALLLHPETREEARKHISFAAEGLPLAKLFLEKLNSLQQN